VTTETIVPTRAWQPVDTLLCEVAAGHEMAFNMLYAMTAARVYALVRKVLIDVGQSEEVTQEVFLEVWQLAGRYDPVIASATTWMLAIAHRRAIDRVRASQASRIRDLQIGARDHTDPIDVVAESAEVRLEHERAGRALHCLTRIQREALDLAYWQGLTVHEISERLGLKRSTVTTRLRDGLFRLRREMENA
jgi:RNA polymerase sigma-70 factor (ECF subfamily)